VVCLNHRPEQIAGRVVFSYGIVTISKGCAEQLCGSHKCYARSVRKSDYFRIVRWITTPKELSRTIIVGALKEGFSRADVMALPQDSAIFATRSAVALQDLSQASSFPFGIKRAVASTSPRSAPPYVANPAVRKGLKRERFVSKQEFHCASSCCKRASNCTPEGGPEAWQPETLCLSAASSQSNRICIHILTRLGCFVAGRGKNMLPGADLDEDDMVGQP